MAATLTPKSPVRHLLGVGTERAKQLERLEIATISDLLFHLPRRYEDRREIMAIKDIPPDKAVTISGVVVDLGTKTFRQGTKCVVTVVIDDGTARLHCRWWNLPFMERQFQMGQRLVIHGRLRELKPRSMDHPEVEPVEDGEEVSIHQSRIVPVYPLTEGLHQRALRGLIWRALELVAAQIMPLRPELPGLGLPARAAAVRAVHFPETLADAEKGRQRLAFDELIELQITLQTRRRNLSERARAVPCPGDNHLIKPFLARLGFSLTPAQSRVSRELRGDLSGVTPMRRLLQGDVGSGKTVVAACAALMVLESGRSVLLMAPTEILAGQHYRTFQNWLSPLQIPVHLHTGSQKTLHHLPQAASTPCLVVGTHALISDAFTLPEVGLVIIDEQHKFGVTQREQLVRKGFYPHLLVMTATPIPRTLGLTLYGDLDISILDELPPGRKPVKTFLRPPGKLDKIWDFIRAKLGEGRQAYVVHPRVDDSSDGSVKAVTKEWQSCQKILAPFRVAMLHGRLSAAEKDSVLAGFLRGSTHVLLSTPLIEVGLDVPNATIILIENAEQFGLAQLHQLRGRVGRGPHESFCVLVSALENPGAWPRLQTLVDTHDGFKIAEADLLLRGPGEFLGQRQSGDAAFRFADLRQDLQLIKDARNLAIEWVRNRPSAPNPGPGPDIAKPADRAIPKP